MSNKQGWTCGSFWSVLGLAMVLVVPSVALGQIATSRPAHGESVGTLIAPPPRDADSLFEAVKSENLGEVLVAAMEQMVQAEEKPPTEQAESYARARKLYERAGVLAARKAEEVAALAEECKKSLDLLNKDNRVMIEATKQLNGLADDVRKQLDESKSMADKAREEALENPDSPLAGAAARQAFMEYKQTHGQAKEMQTVLGVALQTSSSVTMKLRALQFMSNRLAAQSACYRVAAGSYTASAKMLGTVVTVTNRLASLPTTALLDPDQVGPLTPKPHMSADQEKEFAEWMRKSKTSSLVENRN